MKTQDLQQPYRALAEMRRDQQKDSKIFSDYKEYFIDEFNTDNELRKAFNWECSCEKHNFWEKVYNGNTPEIPAESLAELKEWQKEHTEYGVTVIAEQPKEENPFIGHEDKLFTAALAAMQGFIASYAGATKDPDTEPVATKSWNYAEALINEGKKRNLL